MTVPDDPAKSSKRRARHGGKEDSIPTTNPVPANDAGTIVFGEPFEPVDADRWAKMPFWKFEEAICITKGFEPAPILSAPGKACEVAPTKVEEIDQRGMLIDRAIQLGILGVQIIPVDLLKWLQSIEEDFPPQLLETASRIKPYGPLIGASAEQGTLGEVLGHIRGIEPDHTNLKAFTNPSAATRMISTLRKILLGVAVDQFGHDPDRPRNPTARLVSDSTHRAGVPVDEDTIRSHLTEGANDHWVGKPD